MTSSHLLPLCFLATLCLTQAAAQAAPQPQTTVTQPDAVIQTPPLTNFPAFIAASPQITPAPTIRFDPTIPASMDTLVKAAQKLTLHNGNGSCYTMRSYVINRDDMNSNSPRPSSSSTCTESATVKMKDATAPSWR